MGNVLKTQMAIDPDLKEFLNEVLVPMLVRDALKDISEQKKIAEQRRIMANSLSDTLRAEESNPS
jgi:hypothetical protein